MKLCTIDGCVKPASARGWCWGHYHRWRHYGDPEGQPAQRNDRATLCTCTAPELTEPLQCDRCKRPHPSQLHPSARALIDAHPCIGGDAA